MSAPLQEQRPPEWVLRFLRWFCAEAFHEEIEGDLYELFFDQVENQGYKAARRRFFLYVFPYLRPYFWGKKRVSMFHLFPTLSMILNYLKVAWRNTRRNLAFSTISLLGLTSGMVALLFIGEYVRFEKSYDQFHDNEENLYRLRAEGWYKDGRKWFQATTNFPVAGPQAAEKTAEVLAFARVHWFEAIMSPQGKEQDASYKELEMLHADSSFLELFSFPLIHGDKHTALKGPNKVVLTREMAQKYFGTDDVLGEILVMNQEDLLTITAVLEDIPPNSHLEFDFLLSYETVQDPNFHESWGWTNFFTFVKLVPGANIVKLHEAFDKILYDQKGEYYDNIQASEHWRLQRLKDIHLHSGFNTEAGVDAQADIVNLLLAIGIFVMILAWINFINISTARAIERGKEVGIRKAIGASRGQLITQFLLEAFLINGLAMLFAVLLVRLFAPAFGEFSGHPAATEIWKQALFWKMTLGIWVIGSLASGAYPALVLSSFKPVSVLKGKRTPGNIFSLLRKGLVIFQFAMAIGLVIGTVSIYQQIQFMRSQHLGFRMEQVYILHGPQAFPIDSTFDGHVLTFETELLRNPRIQKFTASQSVPGHYVSDWGGYIRRGDRDASYAKTYGIMAMDESFLETYELSLLAGRNFSPDIASDNEAVIINETSLKNLDFDSPEAAIDQLIFCPLNNAYDGTKARVIGVVKDHHHYSLRSAYPSIIYRYGAAPSQFFSLLISPQEMGETLSYIRKLWHQHFGTEPFDAFFLDDEFNESYEADLQFGNICALFAALAIFIALLGLFGLSTYMTIQRTKEISVRKILGASIQQIVLLLSRQYLVLVAISGLLISPLAYWGVSNWLEGFAFHMTPNLLLFMLPILFTVLIAGLAVSWQTIRTAQANPAESLRHE
ncbi:MAG: ABC transporter permease [Bacteroidota bacterium]